MRYLIANDLYWYGVTPNVCYKKGVLKIVTLDIEKRCFLKIRLESEEYNKNINLRFLLYTYTVQWSLKTKQILQNSEVVFIEIFFKII